LELFVTNGVLAPDLFQQFLSQTGTGPGIYYLLFTYVAGTTTPQATYTDATLSVQNANPIILNSVGQNPSGGSIWLNPTLTYKFVYSPPNDTNPPTSPIVTVDNVPGWDGLNLLTQQVLGQILYPQTAAEIAASVTPTDYWYPAGNVLRYGADSSGAAISLPALQAAIAQLRQGGAPVYAPAGAYNLGTGIYDLVVGGSTGLHIEGDGKTATTFFTSTGNGPVFNLASAVYADLVLENFGIGNDENLFSGVGIQIAALRTGCILRNLAFNGNPTVGTSVGLNFLGAISGTYSGEFEVEDCEIYNCLTGVSFNGTMTGGAIKDCRFTNGAPIVGAVGIYQANTCISQQVIGCQFFGIPIGIQTFGQFFREAFNYFESCSTNSFQWNVGAGNSYCNNFSFGDMQLTSTASYPTGAQYGNVVVGATGSGEIGINLGGALVAGQIGGTPALGVFGGGPDVGPSAGWGTATGGGVIANFPGSAATAAQSGEVLAYLINYLKSQGFLAT
jgi:hypothetical protein